MRMQMLLVVQLFAFETNILIRLYGIMRMRMILIIT